MNHEPYTDDDGSVAAFDLAHSDKVTASKAVAAVQPLKPELDDENAQPPYTLAQVIENLALMHGSQDLTWCRWVATDILERGIDAHGAKKRALEYCDMGDVKQAWASMVSDTLNYGNIRKL